MATMTGHLSFAFILAFFMGVCLFVFLPPIHRQFKQPNVICKSVQLLRHFNSENVEDEYDDQCMKGEQVITNFFFFVIKIMTNLVVFVQIIVANVKIAVLIPTLCTVHTHKNTINREKTT